MVITTFSDKMTMDFGSEAIVLICVLGFVRISILCQEKIKKKILRILDGSKIGCFAFQKMKTLFL